jgi:probable phosphoglycerate mutase
MTTTCVLVRHGHVEGIDPPRFRGREDLQLTPLGVRQAHRVRDAVAARWTPDAVFASPLARCRRTAETLAEPFGRDVAPHPGLNDLDYGRWCGMTVAEVKKHWPEALACWQTAPHTMRLPGGETLQEAQARAVDVLQSILRPDRDATVVLVTHKAILRILLAHALGLPLSSYWTLTAAPCSISVIDFASNHFVVHSINEAQHLNA